MPSLRKRVAGYFRQLSFHNESARDSSSPSSSSSKKHNLNENSFVTKYLQGGIRLKDGPPILHGKNPADLPNYELGEYETGPETILGCYSGPQGGLTTVKRQEKHLSVPDAEDIDFIDTANEETAEVVVKRSPAKGQPLDNATMVIKVAGQEYCVTNRATKSHQQHNKSHSLGSLSDFSGVIIETTKIDKEFYSVGKPERENKPPTSPATIKNNNNSNSKGKEKEQEVKKEGRSDKSAGRYNLAKSKSEGNPFQHSNRQQNKKRGRIRVVQRPTTSGENPPPSSTSSPSQHLLPQIDDSSLPPAWQKKSDLIYAISSSLYDRNQVTRRKNGDPIADCFGIISRPNSSILAVADGVNWGEKAAIAAKSAIHASLHYLNKTIFNDTQPFDSLHETPSQKTTTNHRLSNTREVFVSLLRAFSCAHELILENKGMLTTLTVAVVLPLKQRSDTVRYVACVCNVGDTLAYVYSKRYGLRELTKASHDVTANRDMRDALGALGPVDGINPELSNLTLSCTTLNKGDLVIVASDGLTDNFDPNVCRFTAGPSQPRSGAVPALVRSKTTLEHRERVKRLPELARNAEGLPLVSPLQRYELQLLLIEDILRNGLGGNEDACRTARKLCENLVSFTFSMTSAKRHTLEDPDLYFDNSGGVLVEVSQHEQKIRRKKGLERVQNLPGKLDHVTVVAWNVANVC